MQNQKTIFISYGRDEANPQDVDLIRQIKKDLEEKSFNISMDEEQLKTGGDWEIKLENMIKESDWMLFFITPYSARRPDGYCLNELSMSINYGKPIVPIMINYEVPPLSICRLQYLDLQKLEKEEYSKKLDEIINVISENTKLSFEGEHLGVLKTLNPIKFETTISKNIYSFVGREWIKDEVDNWLNKDKSKVLWLKAEAGFGKSAIATYLATKHPSALGIHFCQYDYSESTDAREMLKVLIYQLSTQLSEYHNILQSMKIEEELEKSSEHIFTQLLIEPLNRIKQPEEKQFFIIDALDEAEKNGKNEIVELISNRFEDLPSWLKVVVTSRDEPNLQRKLKKFNPIELETNDKKNSQDLKEFLKKEKQITDDEIIEALIKKSEGNILYLKAIFELDMIQDNKISLKYIEQLPDSIENFYLIYFERKFEDINLYEEKYLDFVSLLVSLNRMPEIIIQDTLRLNDREYNKIKDSFGSLLEVNEEDLVFYHKSIYEWLSEYDKSGEYSADLILGMNKFENFMDSLNSESYKKEYLYFKTFNNMLINYFYKIDNNVKRFFSLLNLFKNNKVIVKTLNNINNNFIIEDNIKVELDYEISKIINTLYNNNPEQYNYGYIAAMNNLAVSCKVVNASKSRKILETLLDKSKKLLQEGKVDKSIWKRVLFCLLINLKGKDKIYFNKGESLNTSVYARMGLEIGTLTISMTLNGTVELADDSTIDVDNFLAEILSEVDKYLKEDVYAK